MDIQDNFDERMKLKNKSSNRRKKNKNINKKKFSKDINNIRSNNYIESIIKYILIIIFFISLFFSL